MDERFKDRVAHESLSIDGAMRTFTVVAERGETLSRPAVVVLHGSKQSGDIYRRFTGAALDAATTDGGAVVAYLDGYRGNWNDARRQSRFPARIAGINDVGFVRAVVGRLTAAYGVDANKVVVVGYSNGGQMVLRLLHEAPDLAAAAVVVSATMPAQDSFLAPDPAPATRPVPVALVHGTHDRIAPFGGGAMPLLTRVVFGVGGTVLSAAETAAYFAARNEITGSPRIDVLAHAPGSSGRTTVRRTAYRGSGHPEVVLYAVEGGGHTIPGPTAAPRILGRTGEDVSVASIVEDLLQGLRGRPVSA